MKAIRIHEDGGPEVLRYEDVADPEPRDGEVLVELRAASLNHLDIWIRKGLPSVPKPRILGADGAGVLAGTEQRVVLNPGLWENGKMHIIGETRDGTHAELIAVPASAVHPIPGDLSFEEAAAFPLTFETAYRMLVTRAGLQAGEWVLVWGVGGGVASAALALAKALGANVVATSSSDEKLARASELGADATVNHATGDVVAVVREVTGGGAHVVVDDVGEATWKRTLDAARPEGRDRRLRRDDRPEPAGGAASRLVEAAVDPRLDDGHAGRLPRRVGPDRRREGAAGRRQRVPAGRGGAGARAARGGPPARQDRAADPGLSRDATSDGRPQA